MLTLPNVRVTVFASDSPTALDPRAGEHPGAELRAHPDWKPRPERLARRDWRKLRERLIHLDLSGSAIGNSQVADWLADAGYTPIRQGLRPPGEYHEIQWKPEYITVEILSWLLRRSQVVGWLMAMEHTEFRRAIGAAQDYVQDQRGYFAAHAAASGNKKPLKLKQPVEEFVRDLSAPKDLDAKVLEEFLLGAGGTPNSRALLHWDQQGTPGVTVYVETPMEAIGLSVHIDRNFSVRRWVFCANCGEGLEQKKSSDRFCTDRCRNYFHTTARRRKITLVQEGLAAWEAMPAARRRKKDRSKWIAAWMKRVDKGEMPVEPHWVARQLRNSEISRDQSKPYTVLRDKKPRGTSTTVRP